MIRNVLLASRFLNRPLALLPAHSAMLFDMVQSGAQPMAFSPELLDSEAAYKPYDLVEGVAIVSVLGCLVHGWDWFCWGLQTPYDRIRAVLASALEDDLVKAIALHIDSPGGEVTGCFDLVDAIYKMRGKKPIHAVVDEACFSAAYALASAADKIVLPRTGGVGSIGIIYQHTSIVGALEHAGVDITTFTYGDRKADGYPTTKMSEAAATRIQADIDTLGELFTDTVARNRGIAASKIKAMQAGTFMGAEGVAAGLADDVMSADEAFLGLLDEIA